MPAKGQKHSAEARRKISEAKRKRDLERIESFDPSAIKSKRCNGCGKTKAVEDFVQQRVKLKNGLTFAHPASRCRECDRERYRAWCERLEANGTDIREYRRRRYRERRAARSNGESNGEFLPVGPLAAFISSYPESLGALANLTGVHERRLRSIREGEQKTVALDTVDRIACKLGQPELLNSLYPMESRGAGYCYLDTEGNPINGLGP